MNWNLIIEYWWVETILVFFAWIIIAIISSDPINHTDITRTNKEEDDG